MTRTVRRLKRWTILLHLYLGVALCALFVMWFATGIVLMYAPFPAFRQERQFARMAPLDCGRCAVPLADALRSMHSRDSTSVVRLGMFLERPAWRYFGLDERWHAIFADDGAPLLAVTPREAIRIAAAYAGLSPAQAPGSAVISEPDQWTVEGVFRHELPLHRVEFTDGAHTTVYVSSSGGEALLVTTRRERALAWIGAIPHWLYPRALRARLAAWTWTIIVVSCLGVLSSSAGLVIGIWQFRFRRRVSVAGRAQPRSPYRTGWMRWHHYLGLLFGLTTFTWMLSGLLSVNPLEWSPGSDPSPAERLALAGGALDGSRFHVAAADAARLVRDEISPRELQPVMVGGRPYWVAYDAAAHTRLVSADASAPQPFASLAANVMMDVAPGLLPSAHIASAGELRDRDDYYYATGDRAATLPVLRVRFDDPARSEFYLDPRTARIAMKQVTRSRLERWLYTGLHDFDFRALSGRRPLWDVLVIVLSLGGLGLSVAGAVAAWRWTAHRLGIPAGPRR
jgi:hypothetical protein